MRLWKAGVAASRDRLDQGSMRDGKMKKCVQTDVCWESIAGAGFQFGKVVTERFLILVT
jgi:hypothetical protein